MDDAYRIKREALDLAVRLYQNSTPPVKMTTAREAFLDDVVATAGRFSNWLSNTVARLIIKPDGTTEYQDGSDEAVNTVFRGGHVELKDNQQVSLTVEAKDAKGFDTNEAGDVVLSWDTSDASIIALQPSADGLSCLAVAGNPGSALVSVSDGNVSGSLAFDVTAGAATSLAVNAGTPEDQPPAA